MFFFLSINSLFYYLIVTYLISKVYQFIVGLLLKLNKCVYNIVVAAYALFFSLLIFTSLSKLLISSPFNYSYVMLSLHRVFQILGDCIVLNSLNITYFLCIKE